MPAAGPHVEAGTADVAVSYARWISTEQHAMNIRTLANAIAWVPTALFIFQYPARGYRTCAADCRFVDSESCEPANLSWLVPFF